MSVEPRIVGPAPLLAAMCDAIGLTEVIDRLVQWDPAQCKLSPGTRIKALVVNILTERQPLYRVGLAFRENDPELLFGRGVSYEDLDDNALARALDKLYDADPKRVFAAIVARAIMQDNVERDRLHWDSTSRSVYGVYQGKQGQLSVTHGYSKDKRPDLRQFLIALLCNREGVPVSAEVQDGNHSDKKGNAKAIDDLVGALEPEQLQRLIYVADSALCTMPNLAKMEEAGLRFVTRMPETFAVAGRAKKAAWDQDQWEELGRFSRERNAASYRACEQAIELKERPYRAIVVHSDHLDKRKDKTLERVLASERQRLAAEAAELGHKTFFCQEDAETAAGAWMMAEDSGLIPVEAEAVAEQQTLKRSRPGRPRAGEQAPSRTVYRLHCTLGEPSPQRLQQWRERENCFVLLTNVGPERLSPRDALQEYKFQTAVETRFKFLKNPVYMDAVYVHRRDRLEALIYVLVMACLIFTLLERRVRKALAQRGEQLIVPGDRAVDRPTATSLLEMLAKVMVIRAGPFRRVLANSEWSRTRTARVLELAGFELSIYTDVMALDAS